MYHHSCIVIRLCSGGVRLTLGCDHPGRKESTPQWTTHEQRCTCTTSTARCTRTALLSCAVFYNGYFYFVCKRPGRTVLKTHFRKSRG